MGTRVPSARGTRLDQATCMTVETFLALVLRLAQGILAVQAEHARVDPADALRWGTAAAYHAEQAGLDPFELIGIARNESDFRPELVGPDGRAWATGATASSIYGQN